MTSRAPLLVSPVRFKPIGGGSPHESFITFSLKRLLSGFAEWRIVLKFAVVITPTVCDMLWVESVHNTEMTREKCLSCLI